MKRCPQCARDYNDDSLSFCLDDGSELLFGPKSFGVPPSGGSGAVATGSLSGDEPATAILSEPPTSAGGQYVGDATRPHIHTTDQTAIFPREAEAEPQESFSGGPEKQSFSANRAAKPQEEYGGDRATRRKAGGWRRQLAVVGIVALVLAVGFFGYRYFKNDSSGTINSIAVLPFQNRSDDADTEYLSDGLAESLIFRLTQLPGLKVSPTSSVMRYKGNETDLGKIAGELGVDSVMTGRLVKRGDNLDIAVELVDTRNNKSLWGEQYQRKMSDLLDTQRDIAATIVQKLQLKLKGDEKGITKKYTDSNEAYQLWMKARFHFAKRTKDDIQRSIDLFQQAIKLDPNFALAYVGVAESYSVMPSFPYMSPKEASPLAKAAVEKALELDPDLPEAHTVAGMIAATYDWDWAKAESEFKRGIELDPNLAITHYRYAWMYLSPLGRHDEAITEMKRAMELEPLSVIQGANFAGVLLYARRFDDAVDQAKKAYDLDPTHIGGKNWLAHAYNIKGMYAESLAITEPTLRGDAVPLRGPAAFAYAKTGRRQEAVALLNRAKESEKTNYVINYWLAIDYAALGDKDAAFAELEKAFQARDWFLQRLKVDPFMDPLRDDPRFNEMVKRLNLPE